MNANILCYVEIILFIYFNLSFYDALSRRFSRRNMLSLVILEPYYLFGFNILALCRFVNGIEIEAKTLDFE